MPVFTFEAMNKGGQEQKGEVDAASREEAITKIRSMGFFPTSIREKGAKRGRGGGGGTGGGAATARRRAAGAGGFGRVPSKLLTQFTRQLSTLQDAGLPILRSLRILEQQQKPGRLKVVIRQVAEDVEGGATLSEAMSKHPKAFDRLFISMVQAGETGGVLDIILQRLAEFMEKSERLRRKVIGAMIYPTVVITFAVLIVMGIMWKVVPKFKEIFGDFGTELPGVTLALLKTSDFIIGKNSETGEQGVPGGIVILLFPFAVFLLVKLLRQAKAGRLIVDRIKLSLPIMGQIVSKTSIARFTRTLGTLVDAGVPILEAINITRDTAGNEVYADALGKVHDSIREGESFANPLRASKIVDSLVVNMVDVGEETGDLDKMLIKVADNYDDEVETLVAGLVSILEPVMVVVLGVIVGFIVVALFLPLVKLINSVTGGG